jgi:hypothetical protein
MRQVAYPSIEEARKSAEAREGNLREAVQMGLEMKRDLERKKYAQQAVKTNAALDILAERKRQIEAEGWTPEHDDSHSNGGIARAASCYITSKERTHLPTVPLKWPWSDAWWKPDGYRRNLVKAGALIIAEIERLDRLSTRPTGGNNHGE